MSRILLLTGGIVLSICLYLGFQQFHHNGILRGEIAGLEKTISILNRQVSDHASLKDKPVEDVAAYYRALTERLMILKGLNGLTHDFEVIDLKESGALESAAKPSAWEGIRQIDVKLIFHDVVGVDQYVRIFRSLSRLRQDYPLEIRTIHQGGKSLEVLMEVYGK